jgi:hypothetical protein
MRVRKIVIAAGITACLLGATASADASQTGGKIRVFVTYQTPTKAKILVTGAIGDYGTTISQDANGKPDPNGNFEKVTLKQGGFIVDGTALNKEVNSSRPKMNKANCSVAFTGTGPTTLEDGTGAYAGITGKIAITITYAGIAQKTAKGCNMSNNAPFYGQYQSITGIGTVSFK